MNVWCSLIFDCVIGLFFFTECTVTKEINLDVIQSFTILQLCQLDLKILWQQDNAPPFWGEIVCNYLNKKCLGHWLGQDGMFHAFGKVCIYVCPLFWPPHSPNLTHPVGLYEELNVLFPCSLH